MGDGFEIVFGANLKKAGGRTVRRANIIGSVIIMLFGAIAVTQAVDMDYWSSFGPGPGFIPLWASIIIICGGLVQCIQALRQPKEGRTAISPEQKGRLMQVAMVAIMTILCALTMDIIGFCLPCFLFTYLLIGWVGKHKQKTAVSVAVGLTAGFYLVFVLALEIPLPKGIMGF